MVVSSPPAGMPYGRPGRRGDRVGPIVWESSKQWHAPSKRRLITDLSYPDGVRVNDGRSRCHGGPQLDVKSAYGLHGAGSPGRPPPPSRECIGALLFGVRSRPPSPSSKFIARSGRFAVGDGGDGCLALHHHAGAGQARAPRNVRETWPGSRLFAMI